MENFRKLETANNELQNFEPRFKNSSQHLVWLGFFSTEVSFFFIFKYILYDHQNRDKLQKQIINTEKKVFSDEKKETLLYSAHIPSFSICLDQV